MASESRTRAEILQRVRQALPHFSAEQAHDLAQVIERLVAALEPERIYLFGSQARGEATPDSDVDLLIVVPEAAEPSYRLAQRGYFAIGRYTLPVELVVMPTTEFERRSRALASLPASVLREGTLLYAA